MVYYLLFSNFYQKSWYDFDKDKKTRRQEDKKTNYKTIVILTAYLRQQQNEYSINLYFTKLKYCGEYRAGRGRSVGFP